MIFKYTAVIIRGQNIFEVQGVVQGDNENIVRMELTKRGLRILDIGPATTYDIRLERLKKMHAAIFKRAYPEEEKQVTEQNRRNWPILIVIILIFLLMVYLLSRPW